MGSSSDITNSPEIQVVFETETCTSGVDEATYREGIADDGTNTNYYTHPAFRDVDNINYSSNTTSRGAWDEEITTDTEMCTGEEIEKLGTEASTTGTIYDDEFSILPTAKYYDLYKGTSSTSITKVKSILGDATWETMKWYSDSDYFVNTGNPWAHRGGNFSYNAGVFSSQYNTGDSSNYSFRVTLIP